MFIFIVICFLIVFGNIFFLYLVDCCLNRLNDGILIIDIFVFWVWSFFCVLIVKLILELFVRMIVFGMLFLVGEII